ncbi:copper resistance CopC family protein [Pseudokineococcus lusitanus]|uniref:CopC domain-containing protein n=1 Tax=Pseudokineococcus lusitanus TaxID=763993 RepID=A0A3N1HQQ0_9ACTN|nr:copper resistance CopC family protein [Pseudokineococcus lusitanus]ROP44756.1 hypothetical protein EDC03_0884 [Pseudokineococcus lusitanus]
MRSAQSTRTATRHAARARAAARVGAVPARRAAAAVGALGLSAGLLLVGAPGAAAHDRLVSSTPAADETLDAVPAEVVLTFSAEVQELGTVAELHEGGDAVVAADASRVDGRDVVLDLPDDLPAGAYDVVYRVTSSDGHPISGEIPFTLDVAAAPTTAAPTPSASPAPSPTSAAPTTSEPDVAPSPTADATEPAAGTDGGVPWAPVVAVLVVVALGAAAAVVLGRRRRPTR